MRKRYTANIVSFILIVVLSFTASPVCYAYPYPPITDIATLDELMQWYNLPEAGLAQLTHDINVDRKVELRQSDNRKGINTMDRSTQNNYTMRVMQGATLVIDNPQMEIIGTKELITVENGGILRLMRGSLYADKDNAPATVAIVVEKGGKLINQSSFQINDGKILDKNDGNELPTDPKPEPEPPTTAPNPDPNPPPTNPEEKPEPPPPLPAIANTMGFDYSLSCLLGEPPASSDYPATEWVTYRTADNAQMQKELPVRWELDAVDFSVAGTYAVKGIFSAEVLAANGLSNPNNIYSTLQLTILKPGALDTLTGNVLSVGSEGNCHIRLAIPPLPEGATALYIHRSADGRNWQKAVQETYTNGHIPSSYDDFLPHAMITPTKLYVQYRYQTDYRPIWLRVEVVGSAVSGISNEIKLEMPLSAKPGDSTNTGETGDDDSSGGNRGGGGQSEGERELPNVQEKPTLEESDLPTEEMLSGDNKISSSSRHRQSGIVPNLPMAGGKVYGQTKARKTKGEMSGSEVPLSTPSDAEYQEVTASSSLPEQETEPTVLETQELSTEVQSSPPLQKSRGVLITAGATAFAAGGLLLLRKLYLIRKRKP